MPLFFFYIMAVIAITSRELCNIFLYSGYNWIWTFYFLQPASKIAVGFAQVWITFELAVRLKYMDAILSGKSEYTRAHLQQVERFLAYGKYIIVVTLTLFVTAVCIVCMLDLL